MGGWAGWWRWIEWFGNGMVRRECVDFDTSVAKCWSYWHWDGTLVADSLVLVAESCSDYHSVLN